MAVTYSKFETGKGYKSPNLDIDLDGNIVAGSIDVNLIKLGGEVLFQSGSSDDGDPVQTALSDNITSSNLQRLGVLTSLTVEGDTTISNGLVQITSATTGSINNINIGGVTPGDGDFVALTATSGTITTLNSTSFTTSTVTTDNITTDTATVNNAPTLESHATNKGYVDTQITALSIALGS